MKLTFSLFVVFIAAATVVSNAAETDFLKKPTTNNNDQLSSNNSNNQKASITPLQGVQLREKRSLAEEENPVPIQCETGENPPETPAKRVVKKTYKWSSPVGFFVCLFMGC